MYDIKQSTALAIMIFAPDSTGAPVTGKVDANWTKRISKAGGAFAAMTVTITEAENGWYSLTLSTAHTDTLGILSMSFNATGVMQINLQYRVHVRINDDLAFPATSGRSLLVAATGGTAIDWANVQNPTTALNLSGTNIDVDQVVASVTGAVGSVTGAVGSVTGAVGSVASGGIAAASFAAGAITAAAIADNAIDAATLASDVVTELRSVASGTSDSGSTTTMVDAARTEADTDYWKGMFILFTSGNVIGQCRLITAFNPATDTITFAPATTQAVATHTYEILPAARVDLGLWLSTAVNALVSGRVDASVGAMAADTVTAAAIATNAIDADALAANAVTEIQSAILSDATPFAGASIDAAVSSRATPAQVNAEVVDALSVDTYAELAGVPGATSTIVAKLNWLFALARNKILQTATTQSLRNDADGADIATATVSDDGTTFTKSEWT